MTGSEIFIALVSNHDLKKADAIFLLEGDGYGRIPHAARLYKEGWAPKILICPGTNNPAYGSLPEMSPELVRAGVPETAILNVGAAKHTRDEAEIFLGYAKGGGMKSAILVTSNFHQYRAFLTFLKAMSDDGCVIQLINSPARDLSWFGDNSWGRRFDLLQKEFEKIEQYGKSGQLATFADGIEYHRNLEK